MPSLFDMYIHGNRHDDIRCRNTKNKVN